MTNIFAVYGFGYAQTAAFDRTGKRAKRIAQAAAHIHFVAAADQFSSSQLMPLTMTVASCFGHIGARVTWVLLLVTAVFFSCATGVLEAQAVSKTDGACNE
ncbi:MULTISPECIES: hypothetical protein [Eikenella]|uniref:hypothetical protein n=1 Tax=Eikenella TaxID=538 RepID=UPI000A64B48C|nr:MULTISPECIES: hypothetical protein [Eikenella]